jgi:hypothetical protein
MKLSTKLIPQFKHSAPEGYSYQVEEFKRGVFSIWLLHHQKYDYNNGKPVRTIWGFYSYKKCEFYSPVNSSTIGKVVNFKDTRNYTAMPIKQLPLDKFFA